MERKMKAILMKSIFLLGFLFAGTLYANTQEIDGNSESKNGCLINNSNKLVVVWSSNDPMVAKRVALMYPHAAKRNRWFDEVILVIWGPSAQLISQDKELQNKLAQMKNEGVIIKACIACANEYNVTPQLKELGYEVIPMGEPLTDYLKKGYKVLTF